jgi:putative aminopeptidase FrvX
MSFTAAAISPAEAAELALLKAVTAIPSAAGREDAVIAYIQRWVAERPELRIQADAAGNLTIDFAPPKRRGKAKAPARRRPLFITAHLDHPAFVVEQVQTLKTSHGGPVIELSFRGGVMDVFFEHAPITIHTDAGPLAATLTGPAPRQSALGKHYLAELDNPDVAPAESLAVGAVATWQLPPAEIDAQGLLHTLACDDLSAVAACLCVLDRLRALGPARAAATGTRVLLTRSEEIGFIGAIAACRLKTIPKGSRVLALENSRSFIDSPIGGGPIIRVGDRLSIFTPWLTAACCRRAEETFGGASSPTAAQTHAQASRRPWQRKLMSGGACEASVFCHHGYEATCLCLPLGNYHNMPHLDLLQAGTYDATNLGPPRAAREYIHTRDFLGLVDLLVALAERLPEDDREDFGRRIDKLYADKSHVLRDVQASPEPRAALKPRKSPRRGGCRVTTR